MDDVLPWVKTRKMTARTTMSQPSRRLRDARDVEAEEHEHHHHRRGDVLVGEEAAPIAGERGLDDVGGLVDRDARREHDPGKT